MLMPPCKMTTEGMANLAFTIPYIKRELDLTKIGLNWMCYELLTHFKMQLLEKRLIVYCIFDICLFAMFCIFMFVSF